MTKTTLSTFIGYHGTSSENEHSILENSLRKSVDRTQWYGEGCYFFTEGVSDIHPSESASQWAIDSAWDKHDKVYKYTSYCVLKAQIDVNSEHILDLRDKRGIILFNKFRTQLIEVLLRKRNRRLKKDDYADYDIFDLIKQNLGIEVVIGNVFIKFAALRRVPALRSNVPNVTILCVDNTESDFVETTTLEVIKKGEISL